MSPVKAIRIRAKSPKGFWRCGRFHGPEWVEHPAGTFSADQIERLDQEEQLEVELVYQEAGVRPDPGPDRADPPKSTSQAPGLTDPKVVSLEDHRRPLPEGVTEDLLRAVRKARMARGYPDGRPSVKALQAYFKGKVTAALRDAACDHLDGPDKGQKE